MNHPIEGAVLPFRAIDVVLLLLLLFFALTRQRKMTVGDFDLDVAFLDAWQIDAREQPVVLLEHVDFRRPRQRLRRREAVEYRPSPRPEWIFEGALQLFGHLPQRRKRIDGLTSRNELFPSEHDSPPLEETALVRSWITRATLMPLAIARGT